MKPSPDRSSAFQQWWDRWTGPVSLLVGIAWLAIIPFTSGSSGVQAIRWVLGAVFVISGVTAWVSYSRVVFATAAQQVIRLPPASNIQKVPFV